MAYTYDKQPACYFAPGTTTVFTMSASSQSTASFGAQTRVIRVATSSQPAFFKIGDGTPTADSTSSMLLGTNIIEYFLVNPGQKLACLQAGSAGVFSVSEMS